MTALCPPTKIPTRVCPPPSRSQRPPFSFYHLDPSNFGFEDAIPLAVDGNPVFVSLVGIRPKKRQAVHIARARVLHLFVSPSVFPMLPRVVDKSATLPFASANSIGASRVSDEISEYRRRVKVWVHLLVSIFAMVFAGWETQTRSCDLWHRREVGRCVEHESRS
jgi:hypothetical protein